MYLIPLGILGTALGKAAEPTIQQLTGVYQAQLNQVNAQIDQAIRERVGDPLGLNQLNNQLLQQNPEFARIANQVNSINAQAQRLGQQLSPQLQQLGEIAGVLIAITATGAVIYDWCSNEPGQAWTAVGTNKWDTIGSSN